MDILFRHGEGTVAEVMADLPDPPSYSAVRSILRILVAKKVVTHREDGPRYVYLPAVSPNRAGEQALVSKTREMAVRALAGRNAPWPWPQPRASVSLTLA